MQSVFCDMLKAIRGKGSICSRGRQEGENGTEEALSQVRISVRNLVEFVMRSGDLDDRRMAGAKKEAMQAGSLLHRKIQRRMGSDYQAEVSLKHTVKRIRLSFSLRDGPMGSSQSPAGDHRDEIKCIYMDPGGRLEEPDPVHMAQALCYGTIYAVHHDLEEIGIQLTYCNIETEEIRRFKEVKTIEEVEDWFKGLIHEYVKWARYLYHHRMRRQECLKTLQFPMRIREGQKELAACVYRSVAEGETSISGAYRVGKDAFYRISSKAMGEGYGEKLFYLTARTITRSVAEEAFDILRGGHFCILTITAKEKLCVLEKPSCNPYDCPRAKGHFDRVNDAVYEIIHEEEGITREKVLRYAERFQVCPFEFCLDISSWTDGIICDYNYVFDPNVRLKRYFAEGEQTGSYLFLVDEAHNLVPRARRNVQRSRCEGGSSFSKRILKGLPAAKTVSLLDACNKRMLELKRAYGTGKEEEWISHRRVLGADYELLGDVKLLALELMAMFGELEAFMNENGEFTDRDLVLELYFKVRDFLNIHDRLDDRYRIYARLLEDGSFMVKLMCMDPSECLRRCLDQSEVRCFRLPCCRFNIIRSF